MKVDKSKLFYYISVAEWENWLQKNHNSAAEAWLLFYRPHTGKASLSQPDAVSIAHKYKWKNTLIYRIDDDSFARKFVPNPNSNNIPEPKQDSEEFGEIEEPIEIPEEDLPQIKEDIFAEKVKGSTTEIPLIIDLDEEEDKETIADCKNKPGIKKNIDESEESDKEEITPELPASDDFPQETEETTEEDIIWEQEETEEEIFLAEVETNLPEMELSQISTDNDEKEEEYLKLETDLETPETSEPEIDEDKDERSTQEFRRKHSSKPRW
jgi:hypothetical protein